MPEEPDVPLLPLVPEEPDVPLLPLVPELPDEPDVPLLPLLPELPLEPLVPGFIITVTSVAAVETIVAPLKFNKLTLFIVVVKSLTLRGLPPPPPVVNPVI